MAIAMALGGLAPTWYYIGIGRPSLIAAFDTLPRLAAAVIAIPALLLFPSVMTYPVCLILLCCASVLWSSISIVSRGQSLMDDLRASLRFVRRQTLLVLSGLISSGYTSVSVSLVAGVNYPAVASFAAADRIRAMAKQGTMSVGNALQGWVSEERDWLRARRRMMLSISILGAVGVAAGAVVFLGLPVVDNLLFGPDIHVSQMTALFCGASLVFTALSISFSYHVLAPLGKTNLIAVATTLGAAVGVPLILILAHSSGAAGAALAGASAEAVVCVVEAVAVVRILRSTLPLGPWRITHA
nr:polysaccharide biosynthesis C-terminal domain-containing protein [Agreia bicolorata]